MNQEVCRPSVRYGLHLDYVIHGVGFRVACSPFGSYLGFEPFNVCCGSILTIYLQLLAVPLLAP